MNCNDCLRPSDPELIQVKQKFLAQVGELSIGFYVLFADSLNIMKWTDSKTGSACNITGKHTHTEVTSVARISL